MMHLLLLQVEDMNLKTKGSIYILMQLVIWPNQKKILGLDGKKHEPEAIAKAKTVALMASRTNTFLSIPMLLSMTAYGHGGFPF